MLTSHVRLWAYRVPARPFCHLAVHQQQERRRQLLLTWFDRRWLRWMGRGRLPGPGGCSRRPGARQLRAGYPQGRTEHLQKAFKGPGSGKRSAPGPGRRSRGRGAWESCAGCPQRCCGRGPRCPRGTRSAQPDSAPATAIDISFMLTAGASPTSGTHFCASHMGALLPAGKDVVAVGGAAHSAMHLGCPAKGYGRTLMCFLLCRLVRERSSALRAPSLSPARAAWPYARRQTLALPANLRHMALITCCASSSCTWALQHLAVIMYSITPSSLLGCVANFNP